MAGSEGGNRKPWAGLFARGGGRRKKHRVFALGAVILLILVILAVAAPVLTPYEPHRQNVRQRLLPPSSDHWMGTDHFGRDVFTRVAFGSRVSLGVGLGVVVLSGLMGVFLGLVAGFYPRLDAVLMRVIDGLLAFPAILLAIAMMAVWGAGLFNIILALTIVYSPRCARLVRAHVLKLKNQEFIEAVRTQGASDGRIILKHVLPNCVPTIVVHQSFVFAEAIMAEATLSFVGAGLPPPTPSWGALLQEAQPYMLNASWLVVFPAAVLVLSVVSMNLIGDALRDWLDPHFQ